MLKRIFFTGLLATIALVSTGCQTTTQNDTSAYDGGVFKSADKGNTWQQRVSIPTTTGQAQKFSGVDVIWMSIDPNDSNAVYYGSIGHGLLYTLDGGGSWSSVASLGNASIRTVEVSPSDKCTVYVSIENTVKKTTDCMRSWQNVYYDNNLGTAITALAIDHYDSQTVYLGSSQGDVIKSIDGGQSWQTINRLKSRIDKIVINPNDSRIFYLVTRKNGIYFTDDAGENWGDIGDALKDNKLGLLAKDLIFVKEEPEMIMAVTSIGIMKSEDSGETWEKINTIPIGKEVMINAIAVNPNNSKEFYYTTYTTFNRTLDGGENWSSIKLPTTRAGWSLMIDPEKTNVLYMGVRAFQQK